MADNVFRFFGSDELQKCPVCSRVVGRERMTFNKQELTVEPSRKNRPHQAHEYQCATRACGCGLKYAVTQPNAEKLVGYSWQCRVCETFTATVDDHGRCLACLLEKKAGVRDAHALFEILEESKSSMGISRSEFLSGFLKGVILGVPGLIYEERND
ncbi:MAG TPA: hypothetical protein VGO93_02170 [Candidatus Xenobia bacterium]|jgi:hypothetical protein